MTGSDAEKVGTRELRFTGEYAPRSPQAKAAIAEMLVTLADAEKTDREAQRMSDTAAGPNPRKRRAPAQQKFEIAATAVVGELIARTGGEVTGLFAPRSKAVLEAPDQYRAAALNPLLPQAIDWLERLHFLHQVKGHIGDNGERRRTVLTRGVALLMLAEKHGIGPEDFGRDRGGDVIVLKAPPNAEGVAETMSFTNDGDTNRMRAELEAFNLYLASADLGALVDDVDLPVVDLSNRRLRRIFSRGSFASGGRLYGGFWQTMGRPLRLARLLIQGEHIAELDCGQAGLRILYGLAHAHPAAGDLYAIPEFAHLKCGREDTKAMISAAMFVDDDAALAGFAKRLCPHIAAQESPDADDFERGMIEARTTTTALEAIRRHHGAVAHFLPSLIGHRVQSVESNVMMRALLDLMAQDIVALPIFDGLLVAESRAGQAEATMRAAFRAIADVEAEVSVKWNPWRKDA